jgi:hypothetical protein
MFTGDKPESQLEAAINKAYRDLDSHPVGTEKYVQTLDAIVKLHKMKEDEKPSEVDKNTALIVGANILGILLIIRHEHVNVITSRAMSTLIKPK